ncbi:MAG: FHA domain-containing protein [Candidatus Promineifilaceae bacterium]
MTELHCQECNEPYKVGALFCEECGSRLFSDNYETLVGGLAASAQPKPITEPREKPQVSAGMIVFFVLSSERRVDIPASGEIHIGREDPNRDIHPHLDLTADDGASLGVSRLHASLQSTENGVMLVDLGSTNGTYLREENLTPHEPSPVWNGDIFQLGHLQVQVFFEM